MRKEFEKIREEYLTVKDFSCPEALLRSPNVTGRRIFVLSHNRGVWESNRIISIFILPGEKVKSV